MNNSRIDNAIAAALRDPKRGLRLLETVAADANDAILITEVDEAGGLKIVYANQAFERMSGYAATEVYGKPPRFMQGPSTSRDSVAKIHDALRVWRPITIDMLNYSRAGHAFWVELNIVPVANDAGRFTHWVSIQRNVSDRHAASALASLAEFLEAQNALLSKEIGERERVAARLEFSSSHDALTGLSNRPSFIEHVARSLAGGQPGQVMPFAILYFDLDRFKVVNDSLGHGVGDALLQRLAERLRTCVGPEDLLARLGGDEFAIFLAESRDRRRAVEIAERVLEVLRDPIAIEAASIAIGASIGIVSGIRGNVAPEHVLRDADIAMYRAKKDGGGRFAVFDGAMHSEARRTYRLHSDLRRAIADDEFVVYYQPLVRLATGETYGFEALVRWRHPERGIVSPQDFVTVAEEIGAISPIGESVLRQACAAWRRWPATELGREPLKLSVNVSSVQLLDVRLAEKLTATMREFELPPNVLQIEITESVLIDDTVRSGAMLDDIRKGGIVVALDDFGTGYSSLSYLERFPIDVIKVDRGFVSRLANGSRNVDVLRTIVELAAALEMELVAEGIETKEELEILLSLGFVCGQGYLFAKPMPEDAVVEWLASQGRTRPSSAA